MWISNIFLTFNSRIDYFCGDNRERLILFTTLRTEDIVLEPNMFPYKTPKGISHYTLWSINDLTNSEVILFVDRWLQKNLPRVRRWQMDNNHGERTIDLFHVHIYIEEEPYIYQINGPRSVYISSHSWN